MSPMALVESGGSKSPIRRKSTRPRYRLDTIPSLGFFSAIFLAVISPAAFATLAEYTHLPPEKSYGQFIAKDSTPAVLPYVVGSFNGLLMSHDEKEIGETRGLGLVSRASEGTYALRNNHFQTREILMGDTQYWQFFQAATGNSSANSISGNQNNSSSKRATTTVYLSLTICSKPILNESIASTTPKLPQLTVYVSTTDSLQEPGPGKNDRDQTVFHSEEGYMSARVSTEGDVYVGIVAPDGGGYSGSYSYQMAASTDAFFHGSNDQSPLTHFVDSGSDAALFTADGTLTAEQVERWHKNNTGVYTMFVNNVNSTAIAGLSQSYCALERHSEASLGNHIEASLSTRRTGVGFHEQFYITGLNRSSTYLGVLAIVGNSTDSGEGVIGGGGKVYTKQNFTTKADGNCAVIYDLDFCSETAYAVPSNPSMNLSTLRTTYDDYAKNLYKNFNYSLQQIQCKTSNETIFSMAVNCDDCAAAYKAWLCAVTIPRCDDYSMTSNATAVMIRNAAQAFPNGTTINNKTLTDDPVTNRPRNSGLIDKTINPGPYMEILPHKDVCHELVRTCPMTLGFQCPKGKYLAYSYDTSAGLSLGLPFAMASLFMALSGLCVFWLF